MGRASAQVKSALLFAGLTGKVPVTIREPYRSRDHTERLFAHLGLGIHEMNGAIVFAPPVRPSVTKKLSASVEKRVFRIKDQIHAANGVV